MESVCKGGVAGLLQESLLGVLPVGLHGETLPPLASMQGHSPSSIATHRYLRCGRRVLHSRTSLGPGRLWVPGPALHATWAGGVPDLESKPQRGLLGGMRAAWGPHSRRMICNGSRLCIEEGLSGTCVALDSLRASQCGPRRRALSDTKSSLPPPARGSCLGRAQPHPLSPASQLSIRIGSQFSPADPHGSLVSIGLLEAAAGRRVQPTPPHPSQKSNHCPVPTPAPPAGPGSECLSCRSRPYRWAAGEHWVGPSPDPSGPVPALAPPTPRMHPAAAARAALPWHL